MTPILYGIWIKGTGWLRGINGVVSFDSPIVAKDTARRLGGEVRYIDDSLKDLEQNILSIEALKQTRKWSWIKWSKSCRISKIC
jgi:hypothetical protein